LPTLVAFLRSCDLARDEGISLRPTSVELHDLRPAVLVSSRCHPTLIDDRFRPLIDAAITAYKALPDLVDVRLQGSVALGEAVTGQSDIDFTAVVAQAPDERTLARLQDRATRLARRYPVVTRVELDALSLADLLPFQRFALSSDSLNVYGTDTLTVRDQWVDRGELARLVTPDAAALLVDFRGLVEETRDDDDEAMRFCSRIVGKDLLKCVSALILLRGGAYEVAIDRIHVQTRDVAPGLMPLADRLYRLNRAPVTDPAVILAVLDEATTDQPPAIRCVARP